MRVIPKTAKVKIEFFKNISLTDTLIGLAANILVDISYGFLDPRIRMGEK